MVHGESSATGEGIVDAFAPESQRERVTVRRRRSRRGHQKSGRWVVARSRQRVVRIFALSAGVLLLMALGLYFGLTRQEGGSPVEGSTRGCVSGAIGVV